MRRRYAILIGLALGVLGSLVGFATVARTAPEPRPYGPPIGPKMARDTGPGEVLVAVVGGVFDTRQEADAANGAIALGDLQGYYVVPVAQFGGLREQLGEPGDFALVSVFRTDEGAAEFAALARSVGSPATILSERVQSFGGTYAGLGQERNLQGTGPLLGPIAESLPGLEEPPPAEGSEP
jgi:hypothetical protein